MRLIFSTAASLSWARLQRDHKRASERFLLQSLNLLNVVIPSAAAQDSPMCDKFLRNLALLIGTGLAALSFIAQSTTCTITGTVTDPSKAVMVGAQLTLTNGSTGLVRTAATNSTGQYVLDFIPVGTYTLRVTQ